MAAVIGALIELAPLIVSIFATRKPDTDAIQPLWMLSVLSPPTSDQDRFRSIADGLRMFVEHPIFGQGLGAYIAEQKKAAYVIIHSTPVWLLAELGLIGLFAFVIPALRILQIEVKRIKIDPVSGFLVLAIVAFGMMSAVHEMLYQRAMWLLLGAALSIRPLESGKHES